MSSEEQASLTDELKLEADELEKAQQQKQKLTLSNQTISLKQRGPQLTLPPYSPYSKDAMLDRPVVLTSEAPTISEMPQQFQGRQAQNIVYEIAQPVQIQGNSQYAYPINQYEDGSLVHFTVSCDSDKIRTVLILYDLDNRAATICNDTARDLVGKGRGMTLYQALAKDMNAISLDNPGTPHSVMPYVSRYKDTFDIGFTDPDDYSKVAGTENDKFYVIEYAPAVPRAYRKIYFNIQNIGADTRTIHYVVVNRFNFIDRYDYGPVPTTPTQVPGAGRQFSGSEGYSSVPAQSTTAGGGGGSTIQARKAKVKL